MDTVDLGQLLPPDHVFLDIPAHTREEVLVFVADRLAQAGAVPRAQDIVDLLLDRERSGATVVGGQAAIPHCRVPGLGRVVTAFARAPEPVAFDLGEGLARLFFFVLSPAEEPAMHLEVLSRIAQQLGVPAVQATLERATDAAVVSNALARPESAG